MKKIIVAVTGASGSLLGLRTLQALKNCKEEIQVHLVLSKGAERTIRAETDLNIEAFTQPADFVYEESDMAALIASGSFLTDGMIVIPCSMKTLSAIANGYDANLVVRAADVCLKEGRRVVLVPREMPLNKAYLRNMLTAAEDGCSIIPPMLTFYSGCSSLEEQMDQVIGKVLMQFGLEYEKFRPWTGTEK